MMKKNHPGNLKRQKYQQDQGNNKVYHMDLDEVMGRSPTGVKSRSRFGGREHCEQSGPLIDDQFDKLHEFITNL